MALVAGDARKGTGLAGSLAEELAKRIKGFDVNLAYKGLNGEAEGIVKYLNLNLPGADGKVKVSGTDTTPAFLESKIVAGAGISVTKIGTGGDEQLRIASSTSASVWTRVAGPPAYVKPATDGDAVRVYSGASYAELSYNALKNAAHDHSNAEGCGQLAHSSLTGIGTNTHAQIDSHIASTSNPHSTSIANLGGGTLSQLNAALSDADLWAVGTEIKLKLYVQTTQPTLAADENAAWWINTTGGGSATFLVFRKPGGTVVSVELTE